MRSPLHCALLLWVILAGAAAAADPSGERKISSPADLHGMRIAAAIGSAQEAFLSKAYADSAILQYQGIMDTVTAVTAGKVDGAIKDDATLGELLRHTDSIAKIGEPMFTADLAVGFAKDNTALKAQLDQFLREIRANGTYAEMMNRWMHQSEPPMPQIPNSGKNGEITIAVTTAGLPIAAIRNNANAGMEFELTERFAAAIGKKPRFLLMDIGAMIPAVIAGKVDMLGGLLDTEERRKRIAFSDGYLRMGYYFFVRKDRLANAPSSAQPASGKLSTAADLHGRRIAVLQGSAYEAWATKNYPDSTILQFQSASDVVLAITSGKADAGINDVDSLRELLRTTTTLDAFGDSLFSSMVGVGFRKGDDGLRSAFNTFLKEIRQNGVYDAMHKRWLGQASGTMPQLPEPDKGQELLIGTCNYGLPMASIQNNELVGFDIELMKRFAASTGKRAKFMVMDFGALIPSLIGGKAAAITCGIFITPERQQRIDFSDPYYEVGNKLYALKSTIAGESTNAAAASSSAAAARAPANSFLEKLAESFQSNIVHEKRYLLIVDGLETSIVISIFATLFGTAFGGLICFMRMSGSALLNMPAKIYISILRGTPVLVLLMLIYYVAFASVNINPTFVAVIAFGLNFAAYFAEIFRSGMSGLDKGQREAGIAMGFTRTQTFRHIILPQTIVRILPVYKGEIISLVKMTSVVGYIAVQDLTKAGDIIRSRTFDAFFPLIMVAILYFLIAGILLAALGYLERRTDPITRRRHAEAK